MSLAIENAEPLLSVANLIPAIPVTVTAIGSIVAVLLVQLATALIKNREINASSLQKKLERNFSLDKEIIYIPIMEYVKKELTTIQQFKALSDISPDEREERALMIDTSYIEDLAFILAIVKSIGDDELSLKANALPKLRLKIAKSMLSLTNEEDPLAILEEAMEYVGFINKRLIEILKKDEA